MSTERRMSRRQLLSKTAVALGGLAVLGAQCGPTPTPKVIKETVVVEKPVEKVVEKEITKIVAGTPVKEVVKETIVIEKPVEKVVTKEVVKEVVKEVGVKRVARERTLILIFGGAAGAFTDTGIGNPFAIGHTHQIGNAALMEPLFFYSAFADQFIPWLAEGYTYNKDFTELIITIRRGVTWSDGKPFTARDVAFTINMQVANAPKLRYSAEFKKWVKEATATDDRTVRLVFNASNPRFLFNYLTSKFDTGNYWVPEHIFKDIKDPTTFLFFDPDKGWPICTGPYRITLWTPTQKFLDLREDWWAAKTGFAALPKAERILMIPWSDETKAAQLVVTNVVDAPLDLRPATMKMILDKNPKVTTHAGRMKPYGYVDWWPISLGFNCLEAPFNDPDIRWAVSYAINREQAVEIAYEGAGQPTILPFPYYKPMMKYIDSIKDLLQQYPTNKYDPTLTAKILTGKGYTKDKEGFWVGRDGKRIEMAIHGGAIFADIGPIVAEQLRKAGFDASFTSPADIGTRVAQGVARAFLSGHGGGIQDPFMTLNLFHSQFVRPTGETASPAWRWANKDFDKIVDDMSTVGADDPKMLELFKKAMEIWLKNLPNCPFIQWYHRIPMNTTYWDGWPTEQNPYVNGAFWHLTFPLILHRLRPTQ